MFSTYYKSRGSVWFSLREVNHRHDFCHPIDSRKMCGATNATLHRLLIDLTKAFDLVSRTGLFEILLRIGCPPTLLNLIISYHKDMEGVISFDGDESDPFPIKNGVKQGCVLAPTLFGIFFSMLLRSAFKDSSEGG